MASIVAGIGASHSIMLMTKLEDWPHFAQVDQVRAKNYFDKAGNPTNYEALLAMAPKGLDEILLPQAMRARYERCQTGLSKLRNAVERIAPDIIVIIGDDQKEMLLEDNLPAFFVYWGKEIVNRPTTKTEAWDWYTEARRRYYEPVAKAFPVASDLGEYLVGALMEANFDVAQSTRQPEHVGEGEGHAFAFPREVLMPNKSVPVVPVCINAYYPPNQPSALRCYDFGKALGACREILAEERARRIHRHRWPEPFLSRRRIRPQPDCRHGTQRPEGDRLGASGKAEIRQRRNPQLDRPRRRHGILEFELVRLHSVLSLARGHRHRHRLRHLGIEHKPRRLK